MKLNKLIAPVAVVATLLLIGAYFASPLLAVNALTRAAREGDGVRLEQLVDFPAVRASMKRQLSAAMTQAVGNDPNLKDNPFTAFGMMLLGTVVDRAVDLYATPDGIAQMVTTASTPQEQPAEPAGATPAAKAAAKSDTSDKPRTACSYDGLNRFRVEVSGKEEPDAKIVFVLKRQGLFGWELVDIRLPTEKLAEAMAQNEPAN